MESKRSRGSARLVFGSLLKAPVGTRKAFRDTSTVSACMCPGELRFKTQNQSSEARGRAREQKAHLKTAAANTLGGFCPVIKRINTHHVW